MLKMKRNVQFSIEVKAGTNVEMSDDVWHAQVRKAILRAEQAANQENVRFHFDEGPHEEDNSAEEEQRKDLNTEIGEDITEEEAKKKNG